MENYYIYTQIGGYLEMKVERYVDKNGKSWVRVKFMNRARTEVIMPEIEFVRHYGKIENYIV